MASATDRTGNSTDRIDAYVWRISAVVIIGAIMSILDTTIVNVALATLSRELHASIDQIQRVVTGYMLSLAAVIPVTGWAARRFGAKRVYITSLVLFAAGSALCGTAFWASAGITALAILPCIVLVRAERAARLAQDVPDGGPESPHALAEAVAA
jgi:MFS family permease